MKFVIILFAVIAVAAVAAAAPADSDAQTVRFDSDVKTSAFQYNYETSNGIAESAQGVLRNEGSEQEAIAVSGSYSYTGPDGQTYTVNYIADENGFQPQGAHLPVGPVA